MIEEAKNIIAMYGYTKWEVHDESVLICPCGHAIEWDGECPDGCVSPLIELGMI